MSRGTGTWGGRDVDRARALMATTLPVKCVSCPTVVRPGDRWVINHIPSRGELAATGQRDRMWDPATWHVQCRPCSDKSGQQGVIDKARAEGARAALEGTPSDLRFLPRALAPGDLRHSPSLSPETPDSPADSAAQPVFDPESLAGVPWLADLLDLPDDAAWPRWMSPPHPDATGSYGQQVEDWLREEQGVVLRWWQRLATRRQLEYDKDGELCWDTVVESCPRRSGKSARARGIICHRLANPDLWGPDQLAMHTGSDMAVCREIQRFTWRWAENVAGWTVIRSNGKESMEALDGSRWLIRSQQGVYGYDVTYGLVDEGWNVASDSVDEGLEPALMERDGQHPQLHITSTAHRKATSLMRRRLSAALRGMGEDWSTLLMVWGAGPEDDIGDESTWRAASPHWSESRRKLISAKFERAMRGESDPETDDPDPIEGFKAQYLNIWPSANQPVATGESVVEVAEWESLNGYHGGTSVPSVAAVEAWYRDGAALALAEQLPDGRVGVSVTTYADVPTAVAAAQASGAHQVLAGKSIAIGLQGVTAIGGTTRQAVLDLRRYVDDGVLAHDGSEALSEQVLALRTVASTDGPRVVSKGRCDAVKATCWAIGATRTALPPPQIF